MWALKTGKALSHDVYKKMVYSVLAVECNLAPEVVDRTYDTVIKTIMIHISERNKLREQEHKRAESKMRRNRRGRR